MAKSDVAGSDVSGPSRPGRPADAFAAVGPAVLADLDLARSRHDRLAALRGDDGAVGGFLADPTTRVLLVREGRVPVVEDASGAVRLHLAGPGVVPGRGVTEAGPVPGRTAGAGAGDAPLPILLGRLDGAVVVALALPPGDPEPPALPSRARWAGLREVGSLLGPGDVGLAVEAVALEAWHLGHPRCPRCGGPTVPAASGHERACPADGSHHHPRSDPAVIMLVVDDDDRVLLGRQATWPAGRWSVLAGFVEPGESLEAAVARETEEEAGVVVGEVSYLGSQPWPFPASLMVAFAARALTTDISVDGDEIAEARWFGRDDLVAALAEGSVRLPPRLSIARHMLEWWAGGPLDSPDSWR